MEKNIPHCNLKVVKGLIAAGNVRTTISAVEGAQDLGIFGKAAMCEVVNALVRKDFYKSMTTHADHRVWQDVYRPMLASGAVAYIKLTVIDDLLIVSFKEK